MRKYIFNSEKRVTLLSYFGKHSPKAIYFMKDDCEAFIQSWAFGGKSEKVPIHEIEI